jgi:hypothetical protein
MVQFSRRAKVGAAAIGLSIVAMSTAGLSVASAQDDGYGAPTHVVAAGSYIDQTTTPEGSWYCPATVKKANELRRNGQYAEAERIVQNARNSGYQCNIVFVSGVKSP